VGGIGSEIWEISHNSLNFNIIEHYFPIAFSVFLYTLRPDFSRKNDRVEVKVKLVRSSGFLVRSSENWQLGTKNKELSEGAWQSISAKAGLYAKRFLRPDGLGMTESKRHCEARSAVAIYKRVKVLPPAPHLPNLDFNRL